jgi:hypothetical protein
MSTANGYAQKVIEALYENGDPVSIDAAELLERLTKNAEPEAEPIYLARRKGLDDFFTCSKDRYNELSVLDLFETKIAYLQPPRPEPARKPLPEKIDPILRTVGSMSCSPSYVAGWNNCIDAMSNGAEARKPMTEEEIQKGVKRLKEMVGNKSSEVYAAFEVGIRVAEKYHGIGRGME